MQQAVGTGKRHPAPGIHKSVAGKSSVKAIVPLVREIAASSTRTTVPVAVKCRVLKISGEAKCRWFRESFSQRNWDDENAISAVREHHEFDPAMGY